MARLRSCAAAAAAAVLLLLAQLPGAAADGDTCLPTDQEINEKQALYEVPGGWKMYMGYLWGYGGDSCNGDLPVLYGMLPGRCNELAYEPEGACKPWANASFSISGTCLPDGSGFAGPVLICQTEAACDAAEEGLEPPENGNPPLCFEIEEPVPGMCIRVNKTADGMPLPLGNMVTAFNFDGLVNSFKLTCQPKYGNSYYALVTLTPVAGLGIIAYAWYSVARFKHRVKTGRWD